MVRAPNEFKNMPLSGDTTPLSMLFQFIAKVFEVGKDLNQEFTSMCGISLIIAVLEHLGERDPLIVSQIDNINMMYIQEMARAATPNYRNMLIQGMMSNFWYDQQTTLNSLKASNNLDQVFHFIFANMPKMNRDFEVKRLVIGLASLTLQSDMPPPQELMPKAQDIMTAIVAMSQKSLELKEKKNRQKEEALEDKDVEQVIYDGDEDCDDIKFSLDEDSDDEYDNWSEHDDDAEDESDGELEDSTLYNVCEILFVKEKLAALEQANPDQFQFMLNLLDEQQKQLLLQMFGQAEQLKQVQLQQEQALKQQQLAYKQSVAAKNLQQVDLVGQRS